MKHTTPRTTRVSRFTTTVSPVAALLLAASAFQAPALAERPVDPADRPVLRETRPAEVLDRAGALVEEGRLIAARTLLDGLMRKEAFVRLSGADAERALTLAGSIGRRIESADPMEMSLQKAECAIDEGDLSLADEHAGAVAASSKATADQRERAGRLAVLVGQRRAGVAPLVAGTLDQAGRDFAAGRYAEAKAGLTAIRRSGVGLTAEQEMLAGGYQSRIVDIEVAQGERFEAPLMLGVMQPGHVDERTDEQPPAEDAPADQPEGQPVDPPADQPDAGQPDAGQPDVITQAMIFEARGLLAEAERAFNDRRINEAQGKYLRLQEPRYSQYLTEEQRNLVAQRLVEVRTRLGTGQPDGIEPILADQQRIIGETIAVFDNSMEQGERALTEGNFDEARNSVAVATLQLNRARQYFNPVDFEARQSQADGLRDRIAVAEQKFLRDQQDRTAEDIRIATQQGERAEQDQRRRQINELLDKARAYQADLRYDAALETVNQILFLDHKEPSARLLKPVYEDILRFREYGEIRHLAQQGYQGLREENVRAGIPINELVTFPTDWPSKSIQRGGPEAFADSEANLPVLRQIATKKVPAVEFRDNNLQDVITFVKEMAQVDIDVQWEQLANVNVQPESTLSLSLKNVTVQTLLDRIIEKVSGEDEPAAWGVLDGILTITSDEAIRKKTALHIYDIRDLLIEVPDYDEVPTIDLQSVLQSGQGGGGGRSPFRQVNDQNNEEDRRTLDERTDDIISILTKVVDNQGWEDNGGTTGGIMKLNGSLIITNTPANHRQITGLLSKLRAVRSMQINVETRFLLVNQDWFEQVGFDLDLYLNAENSQVRLAQTRTPNANVRDFFEDGRPVPVINSPRGGSTVGAPLPVVNQGAGNPPGAGWSPIGFTQDSLGLSNSIAPASDWSDALLGAAPALGIAGSFLDDIQVDFLVRATQADRRSVQLTAPRLTFTNGQISNIYVATQQAFVSALVPVVGQSAVGFNPTVNVVTEGVTLLCEGTISSDRRYVTLNVDAGVSRIDGFAQQAVSAIAGGQLVNSADTQSFIQLPTVTVTRVRTTATIPDQGTILLGGQRLITEYEVETGVPVLSKLPIINRFFTNRIESKEEQTLLILMKPTVIIQSEQEDRNFPGLANDLAGGFGG